MDDARTENTELQVASTEAVAAAAYEDGQTIWNNPALYQTAVKMAKILASSELVPEGSYRGKPANCLIALDMANRMNMSPLNIMQNLYVVKGRPSW